MKGFVKMGRIFVFEGLDGCGKSTQVEMLESVLKRKGANLKRIKLPDYEDKSSELVKMYLAGEFGQSADELSPYAASAFYAVDRIASYKRHWESDYLSDKLIIADRYTTSNAIYQMNKLPKAQWDAYLSWIEDFEYKKLGLPRPEKVIYLDVSLERSEQQLDKRYHGDESKKDIHEKDREFLKRCREAAMYACDKLGWIKIYCMRNGEMRSPEDINAEILNLMFKE